MVGQSSGRTAPGDGLAAWLAARRQVVVVTGAGVSTASGIPDYRDVNGNWKRNAPVTLQQFTGSDAVRRRYWARSHAGWAHFRGTEPNAAHHALAALERAGHVAGIVTQNVDRLHQRAGSREVVDLHGRLDIVVCLECATRYRRDWLQRRLSAMNPDWDPHAERIAPDGDADLDDVDFATFRYPDCPRCGGLLKPDVVFYGEFVPAARRERAEALVAAADGVLVVGSSLMVWSSFRLVRAAHRRGVSVVAINHGRTRADELLDATYSGDAGMVLDEALAALA